MQQTTVIEEMGLSGCGRILIKQWKSKLPELRDGWKNYLNKNVKTILGVFWTDYCTITTRKNGSWRTIFKQRRYSVLGCIQQRIYQEPLNDVDQLKQRLIENWLKPWLAADVVDEATGEWKGSFRHPVKGHTLKICCNILCITFSINILTLNYF